MKTALLFVFSTVVYADGIRQPSGQIERVGINGRTPAHGSYSRERIIIDGQYSALSQGAVGEVQGLSASGQVDAIAVLPIDGAGLAGGITDLPQPLRPAATPEPAAWLMIAGGLLMVGLGRKESK